MKLYAAIVIVAGLAATSCTSASPTDPGATTTGSSLVTLPAAAPTRNSDIVHVPLFIQDVNGQPPSSPQTPLFESRRHNLILAPDGHQVTLAEFAAVTGYASVQCLN